MSHGSPLAYLWRAKFRGRLRDLRRRLASPLGAFSAIVGLLLVGGWVGSVLWRASELERVGDPPSVAAVRAGLALYLLFVASSSLGIRGLYLPKSEAERLLAAPIPRASIVRFRMATSIVASLPFAALLAAFVGPRFASPRVAAVALLVIVPTTAVFGQAVSLLAAPTSGGVDRVLRRVPIGLVRVVGTLGVVTVFLVLGLGPGLESDTERELRSVVESLGRARGIEDTGPADSRIEAFAQSPVVAALTLPLQPWAAALAAPTFQVAGPWLAAIVGLFVLLFEAVARLPVDFRASALRSSEALERRLARLRRGQGGASAFGTSKRTRGLRVPWVAGRSPFGAIVWLRLAWLQRQARGTLFVAAVVAIGGFLFGTRVMTRAGGETASLAVLGVVYLSSGLRADFRSDLDRLESMKAWPLPARSIFAATVLPGATLVALIVGAVLVARAVVVGLPALELALFLPALFPTTYAWMAVDNIVFLLFPVRLVPGQGSAVQNAGRSFLLVLLRAALLLVFLALAGGGGFMIHRAFELDSPQLAAGLGVTWALLCGVLGLALLTWAGGWALRRYDVSKTPAAG